MKKTLKILGWIIASLLLFPLTALTVLYLKADMGEPPITLDKKEFTTKMHHDTLYCNSSYLHHDDSGLWELYIEGSGQKRGAIQGALTSELMKYQEDVFINQIRDIIPSDSYLKFLRTFIVIFNRNLGKAIPLEYRNEIAMMAQFCTHEYDAVGTPYERQLNYHAAHDIGHAMQQYMLVGCSSFAAWGNDTEDSEMIVGRNFDFYVGDDFARNKLITFAVPDSGYRYASVGWAGMVGVLSGMNQRGLTVTINAAKGAIPTSAATPISILTREILQYAATIEEAFHIAQKHYTFVSESILIGSHTDRRAAIIEKTPTQTALFTTDEHQLLCTNHFQSDTFLNDDNNIKNIKESDSQYRMNRLKELIDNNKPLNHQNAIKILRDRLGMGNEDVGIGNEMTLNQSIAHHSVVFEPANHLMRVSTEPWQSGEYICYNLKGFFEGTALPHKDILRQIPADTAFLNNDYHKLLSYRKEIKQIKNAISKNKLLNDSAIEYFKTLNPNHYYTYRLLGDYYSRRKENTEATKYYHEALTRSIPYKSERIEIEKIIDRLTK